MDKDIVKDKGKVVDKVKDRHEAAFAQIPEALPTAGRYLSEATATLAQGAVPAVGFPLNVPPLALSFEAQQPAQPVDTRVAPQAFTDVGVHAASLLSTGAAHVAHATPVVAPAAPIVAQPVSLLQGPTA